MNEWLDAFPVKPIDNKELKQQHFWATDVNRQAKSISINLDGAYMRGRGGGGVWSYVLFLYFLGLQIDGPINGGWGGGGALIKSN